MEPLNNHWQLRTAPSRLSRVSREADKSSRSKRENQVLFGGQLALGEPVLLRLPSPSWPDLPRVSVLLLFSALATKRS